MTSQVKNLKTQKQNACKDCKWARNEIITLEEMEFHYEYGWIYKRKYCYPRDQNINGLCSDFKPKTLVRFFNWLKGLANGTR